MYNNNTGLIVVTDDGYEYKIHFRYDEMVKDAIKFLPTAEWDPYSKSWTVSRYMGASLRHALSPWEHRVQWVGGESPQEVFAPRQEPTVVVMSAAPPDPFVAILRAVGDERRDAVYRALSRVLHPDVPTTGDTALMQRLTNARDAA